MNIIQYLTVGIHTCFRIKKPLQKKIPVIRAICVRFSIKNAGSCAQKSIFSNFFYLFPHKHLQILTVPKIPRLSTKTRRFALIIEGRVFLNHPVKTKLSIRRLFLMATKPQIYAIGTTRYASPVPKVRFTGRCAHKNHLLCKTNPISKKTK